MYNKIYGIRIRNGKDQKWKVFFFFVGPKRAFSGINLHHQNLTNTPYGKAPYI